MVLFEHRINDDSITIKQSELLTELDRLIDKQIVAKAENNFESWIYLAGQIRTIKDILAYFDFPEGRDNTDIVEIGG